jgi:hypothetical protein
VPSIGDTAMALQKSTKEPKRTDASYTLAKGMLQHTQTARDAASEAGFPSIPSRCGHLLGELQYKNSTRRRSIGPGSKGTAKPTKGMKQ